MAPDGFPLKVTPSPTTSNPLLSLRVTVTVEVAIPFAATLAGEATTVELLALTGPTTTGVLEVHAGGLRDDQIAVGHIRGGELFRADGVGLDGESHHAARSRWCCCWSR